MVGISCEVLKARHSCIVSKVSFLLVSRWRARLACLFWFCFNPLHAISVKLSSGGKSVCVFLMIIIIVLFLKGCRLWVFSYLSYWEGLNYIHGTYEILMLSCFNEMHNHLVIRQSLRQV